MRRTGVLTERDRLRWTWITVPCEGILVVNARLGVNFKVFVTKDCFFEPPVEASDGQRIRVRFTQDPAGHTVTISPAFGGGVSVSSTANAVSDVDLIYDSSSTTWSIAGVAQAFPVGSIFIAAVGTDPATLLGYGTWSAIGAGRVLIGQDSGDTDFDVLGETGGTKTVSAGTPGGVISWPVGVPTAANESAHTHSVTSNVAVGDHAAHTHSVTSNVSVADHSSHTHTYTDVVNHTHTVTSVGSSASGAATNLVGTSDASSTTAVTANPAGGVATGTTAGPSITLAHSVTNNAVTSGNPSATLTHSVTNNAVTSATGSAHTHAISWPGGVPTLTGAPLAATSVVQPYLVVKMWQRTA